MVYLFNFIHWQHDNQSAYNWLLFQNKIHIIQHSLIHRRWGSNRSSFSPRCVREEQIKHWYRLMIVYKVFIFYWCGFTFWGSIRRSKALKGVFRHCFLIVAFFSVEPFPSQRACMVYIKKEKGDTNVSGSVCVYVHCSVLGTYCAFLSSLLLTAPLRTDNSTLGNLFRVYSLK